MIIGACADGSFISFKGYSGVLPIPGFLVADLDMAMRNICAEKSWQHSVSAGNMFSSLEQLFVPHANIIVRAHIHRERTVFSPWL